MSSWSFGVLQLLVIILFGQSKNTGTDLKSGHPHPSETVNEIHRKLSQKYQSTNFQTSLIDRVLKRGGKFKMDNNMMSSKLIHEMMK
jgi:hypothetical protein